MPPSPKLTPPHTVDRSQKFVIIGQVMPSLNSTPKNKSSDISSVGTAVENGRWMGMIGTEYRSVDSDVVCYILDIERSLPMPPDPYPASKFATLHVARSSRMLGLQPASPDRRQIA